MMDSIESRGGDASATTVLPERNSGYLDPNYWDKRFEEEENYEWFAGYPAFRDLLLQHVKPSDKVLQVGSGTSSLAEDLFSDGIRNILSTDLSPLVVDKMQQRARERGLEGLRWQVADLLALPFPSGSFDVVLEKGALDVLLVDAPSAWDPGDLVRERVHAALAEAHRVLTPTGVLVSITFGQPHFRRPLFEAPGLSWEASFHTFGDGLQYFLYVLRKGTRDPTLPAPLVAELLRSRKEGTNATDSGMAAGRDMEHEEMDNEDYLLRTNMSDSDD